MLAATACHRAGAGADAALVAWVAALLAGHAASHGDGGGALALMLDAGWAEAARQCNGHGGGGGGGGGMSAFSRESPEARRRRCLLGLALARLPAQLDLARDVALPRYSPPRAAPDDGAVHRCEVRIGSAAAGPERGGCSSGPDSRVVLGILRTCIGGSLGPSGGDLLAHLLDQWLCSGNLNCFETTDGAGTAAAAAAACLRLQASLTIAAAGAPMGASRVLPPDDFLLPASLPAPVSHAVQHAAPQAAPPRVSLPAPLPSPPPSQMSGGAVHGYGRHAAASAAACEARPPSPPPVGFVVLRGSPEPYAPDSSTPERWPSLEAQGRSPSCRQSGDVSTGGGWGAGRHRASRFVAVADALAGRGVSLVVALEVRAREARDEGEGGESEGGVEWLQWAVVDSRATYASVVWQRECLTCDRTG